MEPKAPAEIRPTIAKAKENRARQHEKKKESPKKELSKATREKLLKAGMELQKKKGRKALEILAEPPSIQTQSENAEIFLHSSQKIDVELLNKTLSSGDGTNIGYLSLESQGYPGIGLRISKGRFVDNRDMKFIANQPDYLAQYFEQVFLKPGRLRTLISEVLSSGIREKAENGDIIETPNLFGHALVNRKTGEILSFPYPAGSNVEARLDVVKKMLIEQANKLKIEGDWEYASIVSNVDGLDDKNKFRPASDYFDPNSKNKDYDAGLDALQSSSHLVSILKKKGLAVVDPGSNPPLYNSATKKCTLADIGSFGFTDNNTQQSANTFIRNLAKESGMKPNNALKEINDNKDIFVDFTNSHSKWEEMMRLDEIRDRVRFVTEVPWIGLKRFNDIKEYWQKFRSEPYDPSKSEERLAMSKKLMPFGGRDGIDLLLISLEDSSSQIRKNLNDMIQNAGRDLFLVNMGRDSAQKGLRKMNESHKKVKTLFSDVFNIK